MKQIRIEKTDTGYILRPSTANRVGYILLSSFFLALGVFSLTSAEMAKDSKSLCIIGGMLLSGLGLFLLLAPFRRVVMDENGVRLYRLGRLLRDIPWKEVKAWGTVTHSFGRSYHRQKASYLYFSPVKGQTTGRRSVFMEISPKDETEIAASRITKYIRKHLSDEE